MQTIFDLILIALVVIYIVDLSGFSDTLLTFVSTWKGRRVTELKPFTCSLCMVWWVCLAYLLMSAKSSLPMVAVSALLSFLSAPIGQLLFLIREAFNSIINKIANRL